MGATATPTPAPAPTPPKSNLDLSKITGPYPLLGAFLVVVEGLLGFWLFKAANPIERSFAGLIMAGVLLGFLWAFLKFVAQSQREQLTPAGLPAVTPAKQEVTPQQVAQPEPEVIAGPDGTYTIMQPPDDWEVRQLSAADWTGEKLQLTDPSVKKALLGAPGERNVLSIRSPRRTSIVPIPGETVIDGRIFPTALEVLATTELTIVPLERASPPFYTEHSLEHNAFLLAAQFPTGVLSMQHISSTTLGPSNRRVLRLEFSQRLDHVMVNGRREQTATNALVIVAIEGEISDYVLLIQYAYLTGGADAGLTRSLEILSSLISSFRPLKLGGAAEQRRELREAADAKFEELIAAKGSDIFGVEFKLLVLRLRELDLNDAEQRQRSIRMVKPFQALAEMLGIEDEALTALWDALRKAEEGDAREYKKLVGEACAGALEGAQDAPPALPEGPPGAGGPA
jgi:hypothetical protein